MSVGACQAMVTPLPASKRHPDGVAVVEGVEGAHKAEMPVGAVAPRADGPAGSGTLPVPPPPGQRGHRAAIACRGMPDDDCELCRMLPDRRERQPA